MVKKESGKGKIVVGFGAKGGLMGMMHAQQKKDDGNKKRPSHWHPPLHPSPPKGPKAPYTPGCHRRDTRKIETPRP